MSDIFRLPELASRYLLDPRIANAVDDLTGTKMTTGFDTTFHWTEFPDYVGAWLAAQQTVAEWCQVHFELWDMIWGDAIGAVVKYPDRQSTFDLDAGGIAECWQDGWSSRHVSLGRINTNLAIYIEDMKVSLAFSVPKPEFKNAMRNFAGWEPDEPEIIVPGIEITRDKDTAVIDLRSLRQQARKVVAYLKAL